MGGRTNSKFFTIINLEKDSELYTISRKFLLQYKNLLYYNYYRNRKNKHMVKSYICFIEHRIGFYVKRCSYFDLEQLYINIEKSGIPDEQTFLATLDNLSDGLHNIPFIYIELCRRIAPAKVDTVIQAKKDYTEYIIKTEKEFLIQKRNELKTSMQRVIKQLKSKSNITVENTKIIVYEKMNDYYESHIFTVLADYYSVYIPLGLKKRFFEKIDNITLSKGRLIKINFINNVNSKACYFYMKKLLKAALNCESKKTNYC